MIKVAHVFLRKCLVGSFCATREPVWEAKPFGRMLGLYVGDPGFDPENHMTQVCVYV